MSNARSPRDVCSTTIGTRGLMEAAVYRRRSAALRDSAVARGPEPRPLVGLLLRQTLADAFGVLTCCFWGRAPHRLTWRPDLLAGRRLLERDRLGRLDDYVGRLAHPDLVAKHLIAALGAKPLEQALGGVLSLAGPDRLDQLFVGDLDVLRGGDGLQRCLAAKVGNRIVAKLGEHALPAPGLHLHEGIGLDAAVRELVEEAVEHLLRPR